MSEVEIVRTTGRPQVTYAGYIYSMKKTSTNAIRWRCIQCQSLGCNGAMTTDATLPFRNPHNFIEHCHPPNDYLRTRKDIITKLREAIEEKPDMSIAQVVKEVFQGISEEEKARLGKVSSYQRYLRHFKMKARERKLEESAPPGKVGNKSKNKKSSSNTEIKNEDGIEYVNLKTPNDPQGLFLNESIKIEPDNDAADLDVEVDEEKKSRSRRNLKSDYLSGTHTTPTGLCENLFAQFENNGASEICSQLSRLYSTSNEPQNTCTYTQRTGDRELPQSEQAYMCQYSLASQPERRTSSEPSWHQPHHPSFMGPLYTLHSSQRVQGEVAGEVDPQPTSSITRARKAGSAKKVDNKDGQAPLKQDGAPSTSTSTSQFPIPDFSASTSITQFGSPEASTSITQFGPPEASISKSNAEFISQEPSTSTSGTQFSPPENPPLHVPELFESHMYVSPTPMSFPEEMSARQNVDAIGIETQTSNLCPPDPIPTPTECTNTVKVKPIDTLQSKKTNQGISEPASKENKAANVDISVKTLESAIQRLESVSNKLAAVSLFDSYDQFGKYISSVLRGLPIRKVHSLKQKIITDVMQALTNDETLLAKNTSSQDRGPDVGQTHGKFSSEQSQQMRQLLDPKSFGGRIPVGGSIPVVYAKTLPPNTSTISQASQTTLAANIASNVNVSSGDNLQIADIGFISSIAPNTEMCKPYASAPTLSSRGRGRKRSGAPVTYTNKKKASQETSGGVMSVNPSGDGLSWDQQPTDSQQVTNLEDRLQDSKDSNEGGFTNDLEMNCEQEFDIDIEEGKELAQFKEDQQDSFETVLCGEGSEYFIKEEPPECELTAAAVTSASALTPDASTATCHVCSERCTSREQLLTHFRTAHPGTVAATSAQTSASTTTCWMCSKTCGSREDLLTHFRTAHPGPGATSSQASKTTCWVCNKTWSSKEDFFTHFRTEHPEYAVPGAATSASALTPDASAATCHVCSERCSSREELLTHFRTAHPGVGYMGT